MACRDCSFGGRLTAGALIGRQFGGGEASDDQAGGGGAKVVGPPHLRQVPHDAVELAWSEEEDDGAGGHEVSGDKRVGCECRCSIATESENWKWIDDGEISW